MNFYQGIQLQASLISRTTLPTTRLPCPLFPYLLLLLLAGKDLYPTLQNTLPRDKRRHRPTDVVRLQRAAGWGTSLKTTRPGTERVLPTLGASPGRGALGHRVCQWHEWLASVSIMQSQLGSHRLRSCVTEVTLTGAVCSGPPPWSKATSRVLRLELHG